MSSWLKEKGSGVSGIHGGAAAFVAILQLFVVASMNQHFHDLRDYMDQRFDAQDERLDQMEEGIRNFDHRVSRNEAQIEIILEKIESVDAP